MNIYVIALVVIAAVVAIGWAFVWANRNKPDMVDKAEQKIRDYKKKS